LKKERPGMNWRRRRKPTKQKKKKRKKKKKKKKYFVFLSCGVKVTEEGSV
jgi:hypothetical protein